MLQDNYIFKESIVIPPAYYMYITYNPKYANWEFLETGAGKALGIPSICWMGSRRLVFQAL